MTPPLSDQELRRNHTLFNRLRLRIGYIFVRPDHVQIVLRDGLYDSWIPEGIHWGRKGFRHSFHQPQLSVGMKPAAVEGVACRSRDGLLVRIDANILFSFHPRRCAPFILPKLALAPSRVILGIAERYLKISLFEALGQYSESDLRRGTITSELKTSFTKSFEEYTEKLGIDLIDVGITGVRPDERVERSTVEALSAAQFAQSIEGLDPETQRLIFERENYKQIGRSDSELKLEIDSNTRKPTRDKPARTKRRDSYPDN